MDERVLIAAGFQNSLSIIADLEAAHYTVLICNTITEVLDCLAKRPVNAVIADLSNRVIDSIELILNIQDVAPHLAILGINTAIAGEHLNIIKKLKNTHVLQRPSAKEGPAPDIVSVLDSITSYG